MENVNQTNKDFQYYFVRVLLVLVFIVFLNVNVKSFHDLSFGLNYILSHVISGFSSPDNFVLFVENGVFKLIYGLIFWFVSVYICGYIYLSIFHPQYHKDLLFYKTN